MVSSRLKGCYIATSGRWSDDYNAENMKRWISHCSGTYQTTVNDDTTHLVVTEDHWHENKLSVVTARERIEQGQKIKIVKFEWLDSMINKNKVSERKYLWANPSKERRATQAKPVNKSNSDSLQASVVRAFEEHTNGLVDDEEVRRATKRQRQENEAAERERLQEEKEQEARMKTTQNPVVAEIFKKNAKRAAKDVLSGNYNVYRDSSGFAYDITITKVAHMENRNERWAITLQIYESNTAPHTYAVNAQFSGTATLPRNEIITSIGSTWDTAFRRFKLFFKNRTWIDWEDRIEFAMERNERERASRSYIGTNSISRGRWGDDFFTFDEFSKAPFQYEPPAYGPRGLPFDVSPATATHASDTVAEPFTHKQDNTGSASNTPDIPENPTPESNGSGVADEEMVRAESLGQTTEGKREEVTTDGADAHIRDLQDSTSTCAVQDRPLSPKPDDQHCQTLETESLVLVDSAEPSPRPHENFTQLNAGLRERNGSEQRTMSGAHNSDESVSEMDSVLVKRRNLEEVGTKTKRAKTPESHINQHEHAGSLSNPADSSEAD